MEKIYRVQMNSNGMPNFATAVEIDTDISKYSDKLWKNAYERGKADRPQGWIPCSEKLPDDNREVLISLEWGIDIGTYERGEWRSEWINHYDDDNVLAWMPLPKPWKGADNED